MIQSLAKPIVLRRITAFILDCLVLAVYAGVLFVIISPKIASLFQRSPFLAELVGFTLLTLPFGLYFIFSEASHASATIGKRALGLKVVDSRSRQRITLGRSVVRTTLKLLPWELAHFSIWHVFVFDSGLRGVGIGALTVSYCLMALYAAGLFLKPHRPLYDRLASTGVVAIR